MTPVTVVTEPHPDGWGHRWLLLDHATGEILATGQHPYSTPENAEVAGERQLHAAATLPTPDHLEPA